MEIGEKIKSLRLAKRMTQSELAGDQITRNMLSLIENGSALPSLTTVIYLSERLGVPTGMLLARDDEELFYKKLAETPKIKQMYGMGEYRLAYDMCMDISEGQMDDELYFILSRCCFEIAKENFYFGKLRKSVRFFDRACEYSKKTSYDGDQLLSSVAIYLDYLVRLSPTLSSENGNESYKGSYLCADPFGRYALAMKEIEASGRAYVGLVSENDGGFYEHVAAKIEMINGNYVAARERLKKLIHGDALECRIVMYDIFKDLEECCREIEDYKGAYEYSVGKVELLEHMLRGDSL